MAQKLLLEEEIQKQKEIDYFRTMVSNYSGLIATLKRCEDKIDLIYKEMINK